MPRALPQKTFWVLTIIFLAAGALFIVSAPKASIAAVTAPTPLGACTSANLSAFNTETTNAVGICNRESFGDPRSLNDACLRGGFDYSVGLFQINLFRTGRCPGGFSEVSSSTCRVENQTTVDQCVRDHGGIVAGEVLTASQIQARINKNAQKATGIFAGAGGTLNSGGIGVQDIGWCQWTTAACCLENLCPDPNHPIQQQRFSGCTGTEPACIALSGGTPPNGGDNGGRKPPEGSTPKIGGLKLEVGWPAIPIPGGTIQLQDIAASERICLATLIIFTYALALWLGAILAFLTVVYVGAAYLLSGSRPGLRAQAFSRARTIFIGLIILFTAVVILNIVDPGLKTIGSCGLQEIPELELQGTDIGGEVEFTPIPPPTTLPPRN